MGLVFGFWWCYVLGFWNFARFCFVFKETKIDVICGTICFDYLTIFFIIWLRPVSMWRRWPDFRVWWWGFDLFLINLLCSCLLGVAFFVLIYWMFFISIYSSILLGSSFSIIMWFMVAFSLAWNIHPCCLFWIMVLILLFSGW